MTTPHLTLRLCAGLLLTAAALTSLTGCDSARKRQKEEAARNRAAWIDELRDSVAATQQTIENYGQQLRELQTQTQEMLGAFTKVENPRLVEGYYIMSQWTGNCPPKGTSVVARILLSEQMEVLASLAGGSFDRIEVIAGENRYTTPAVPHDQALNYRDGSTNVVAWSGAPADTVGHLITDNAGSPVTINYYEGPRRTGSLNLDQQTRDRMASTWALYDTRRRSGALERALPMLTRKLESMQSRIDSSETADTGSSGS